MRWTEDKIRRLRELAREGKTAAEAGKHFGVSEKAIVFQGHKRRIKFNGVKNGYQPHEDRIIRDMVAKGYAWTAISKHLPKRSADSVSSRAKSLGIKLRTRKSPLTISKPEPNGERKKRTCLSCGEKFDSEWIGNRVCSQCKSTRAWKSAGPDHSVAR